MGVTSLSVVREARSCFFHSCGRGFFLPWCARKGIRRISAVHLTFPDANLYKMSSSECSSNSRPQHLSESSMQWTIRKVEEHGLLRAHRASEEEVISSRGGVVKQAPGQRQTRSGVLACRAVCTVVLYVNATRNIEPWEHIAQIRTSEGITFITAEPFFSSCIPWQLLPESLIEENRGYLPPGAGIDEESVEVIRLLDEVSSSDVDLRPTDEGCGGAYFVGRNGSVLGVFKPVDEEVGAENNPRGYRNEARRDPGAPREVAAYQLDQRYGGWSRVPATTQVKATTSSGEEKSGSLQAHVEHIDSAENFGSSMMPTLDLHKIAVLDIRLFNTDRHFANILVSKGDDDSFRLTPIDHGATLPGCFDLGRARFEWMQFKQSKLPPSSETLSYIEALDIDGDTECLRALGIEEECITSMILSTKVLQLGAQSGLSLSDIGNCIQRDLWTDELSPLETSIFKIAGASPTAEEIRESSTKIAEDVVFSIIKKKQEMLL